MATMEDKKVYVGFAVTTSDPAKRDRRYFKLLPVMTGHRDKHQNVQFTTFYSSVYRDAVTTDDDFEVNDFAVVLPVIRLVSIRLFDMAAYQTFRESSGPQ